MNNEKKTEPVIPEGETAQKPEGGGPVMPQVTFTTFILSLASSALVQLGEVPDPVSGKLEPNLPIAKHTIDVLAMLREKTACSLSGDEAEMLDGLIYELRMKYVLRS